MTRTTAKISSTSTTTQDMRQHSSLSPQPHRKLSLMPPNSRITRAARATQTLAGFLPTPRTSRKCTSLRTMVTWKSTSGSRCWLSKISVTTTSILSRAATRLEQSSACAAFPTSLISTGLCASASQVCTSLRSRQRRRIKKDPRRLKNVITSLICFVRSALVFPTW